MSMDRQPLYMKIQDHFKQLILEGKLKENDKIPSEKELMEQFGVSRITVANALIQLAKEGWIYRIPGKGSFVSDNMDKRLLSQAVRPNIPVPPRTESERNVPVQYIGLIMPDLIDYFGLRLINGINRMIENSPYRLQIVQSFHSIEREKEAIADFIAKGAAGLIIFPCDAETYNEDILALKLNGFPFVLVDRYFRGVDTNVVYCDGFAGGKMAADYLWNLGHRDIAICSDSPLSTITVEDRINGYLEELKNKKAMINPALILTEFSVDYNGVDTQHPLYRFIKNRMASAYITLNGRLGLHIYAICRQIGLRVPEDVSILTFDDPSPELEQFGFFSHISQSEREMGEKAARILLDLLESPRQPEPRFRKIVLEPQLVKRNSTGPAAPQ